jgi:hypothetical protein
MSGIKVRVVERDNRTKVNRVPLGSLLKGNVVSGATCSKNGWSGLE